MINNLLIIPLLVLAPGEFLIGRAGYQHHIAHYEYFNEVSHLARCQTIALIDAGAGLILIF